MRKLEQHTRMEITRRSFLSSAALAALSAPAHVNAQSSAPAPFGALPSKRQLAWSELEFYNFLHFTVNTFTDREWGNGDEDPSVFNPTQFDADAIVETLKAAGSKGVILTCKHHDGFCLWPTQTTDHSIKNSPYRGGQGDIVREVSQAAARHGLKFGVYLSPWDRNQATYGTPQYIQLYRQQLRELLTQYGPVFEIWHDGANGGTGFYGGQRGTRTIDKLHYYDWPNTWALERELQPGAAIFSDVGPDVRWVGNEKGMAGETCWATYTPHSPKGGPGSPGDVVEAESTIGTWGGEHWMPAECDVSIRPGWFWHAKENGQVKTPDELMGLYHASVGRGASFLLNVPPDRRGLLDANDTAALRGFGKAMRHAYGTDLAHGAKIMASNVRAGDAGSFGAQNAVDGNRSTYWSTDNAVRTPVIALDFGRPVEFAAVRLREFLPLGQRIQAFNVEYWSGDDWLSFGEGTSVGMCRIVRSQKAVTSARVRVNIVKAAVCPAISEVAVFAG